MKNMSERSSRLIQKLSGCIRFWSSFRFSGDKMQDKESESLQDLYLGIEDI